MLGMRPLIRWPIIGKNSTPIDEARKLYRWLFASQAWLVLFIPIATLIFGFAMHPDQLRVFEYWTFVLTFAAFIVFFAQCRFSMLQMEQVEQDKMQAHKDRERMIETMEKLISELGRRAHPVQSLNFALFNATNAVPNEKPVAGYPTGSAETT